MPKISSKSNFSYADSAPFPRRYITVGEFCAAYGVSRQKAYHWINAGVLEAPLVAGTMRRVSVDSAEALFRSADTATKIGPMARRKGDAS
jgi:excisionase family DNA binding protein